jgi:hypothetical protein
MRPFSIILSGFLTLPAVAFGQTAPATCTTLVTIQSQECFVRRVVTCDDTPDGWMSVGGYGPDGASGLSIFNADGVPQRIGTGPGTPQTRLGEQTDPFDLQLVMRSGLDSFAYQLVHDDGSETLISGKTRTTGETVTVDGRSLQVLQSRQLIAPANGTAKSVDVTYFYDADLRLLITDIIRDADTGDIIQHRSPVDFIWPGETGFEDYTPLYGCEG